MFNWLRKLFTSDERKAEEDKVNTVLIECQNRRRAISDKVRKIQSSQKRHRVRVNKKLHRA